MCFYFLMNLFILIGGQLLYKHALKMELFTCRELAAQ